MGGFVAQYKGWRWTQWCMLFLTLTIYILALPVKETYKPIILKKRAKKSGLKIEQNIPMSNGQPKPNVMRKLFRPMYMLFTEVCSLPPILLTI